MWLLSLNIYFINNNNNVLLFLRNSLRIQRRFIENVWIRWRGKLFLFTNQINLRHSTSPMWTHSPPVFYVERLPCTSTDFSGTLSRYTVLEYRINNRLSHRQFLKINVYKISLSMERSLMSFTVHHKKKLRCWGFLKSLLPRHSLNRQRIMV